MHNWARKKSMLESMLENAMVITIISRHLKCYHFYIEGDNECIPIKRITVSVRGPNGKL